jgi:hypothetical protein
MMTTIISTSFCGPYFIDIQEWLPYTHFASPYQKMVLIPHGFGIFPDSNIYGINVNYLTKNTHRDPMGIPVHRFVPCRVEAVSQFF